MKKVICTHDDKDNGCRGVPHEHWYTTGFCLTGPHAKCPAVVHGLGGRKPVMCICQCHKWNRLRTVGSLGEERTVAHVITGR